MLHGRYALPLYENSPPVTLFASILKHGHVRAMAEALADNYVRMVDNAYVTVRLADARRTTELSREV